MAGETIQFVDSVSDTATVRLNLTTAPWSVLFNGTDIPPPPLRRATSTNLLSDGDIIPASAYANRVLTLRLELDAVSPAVSATELQKLNRELDRVTNILRWQPQPAIPAVYFRTFRSPDYAEETDHGINRYTFTIQLVAEPFALGTKEIITPTTIYNDPNSGSGNQKCMDITGVKGDVETSLIIRIAGSSASGAQSLFAMRRHDTPSNMPMLMQAEACTLGSDTTVGANNALWSGAGSNQTNTTFSTVTVSTPRLTFTWPPSAATPTVDMRGTYKVFARCYSSTSSSTYTLKLRFGNRVVYNNSVTVTNAFSFVTMIELGLMQVPVGMDPITDGLSGTGFKMSPGQIPVQLYASRDSGTGTLTIDYLLFVPADDKLSIVTWGVHPASGLVTFVFDGTKDMVYGVDSSNQLMDMGAASYVGEAPMVSPGQTNRLVFIRDVSPVGTITSTDAVGGNTVLTIWYYPRYLMVRPIAT
jgi:hypothetical protein